MPFIVKRDTFIILLWSLIPVTLFGQIEADSSFLRIEEKLLTQLAIYPQEKLHLHTDRDIYVPGEKIWFKAYLTDAATFLYPTYSRYVYVELIDLNDSLINRVMIRTENEMFYGYLPILNIIPEGNYTLRAYTRYMENLGDDYFFKKNIRIGSLSGGNGGNRGSGGNRESMEMDRRGERLSPEQRNNGNEFEVSFFPEGGNLVEGAFCKVAFKALNRNGCVETISGVIVDEDGVEITTVQTVYAGMGAFTFIPNAGKRYFLNCRNENGIEKKFELPKSDPRALALTVSQRNKMITIGVRRPLNSQDMSCYLLAHCRGQVFHFSALNKEHDFISFHEEALPAGILQFILFDKQLNPLSERLVFNKNNTIRSNVTFYTDKTQYGKRDKVFATLSLFDVKYNYTEMAGDPESSSGHNDIPTNQTGHFSVAITDDRDIAVDSSTTILSTLLLSSELKGYIYNPEYYLQDNNESIIALDYMMLTHGWRRYNIPEVVKANFEIPQIPFQTSQQISGKLKGGIRSRPVPNSEVMIMTKEGDFGLTNTNENSIFIFDNFEYPDSTSYFIHALGSKLRYLIEPVLYDESFPKVLHAPQNLLLRENVINTKTNETEIKDSKTQDDFIAKAEQRSKYDENVRVINLSEVIVTAQRIEKKNESRLQFWANRNSDITIRREEIEKTAPRYVSDWLRNIPGVKIFTNGEIMIRNAKTLNNQPIAPYVLIDGMPVAWPEHLTSKYDSPLESVSVHDVESINVFKGADAAAFGVRGAGGVISITTKRGIDEIREIEILRENKAKKYTIYSPLGYQKPVEFYSPKYETLEAKNFGNPDYRTTIFWKPDIVVSEEGKASFEFYTSDFSTTYSVVIEGLTTDGRIIRQVERIVVSE